MARKTTKIALVAIQQYEQTAKWITEVINLKETAPLEDQLDHIKNNPKEYWIGMAIGSRSMCESILHNQGCYHGFAYLDKSFKILVNPGKPITEHPEYADWRVSFGAK